MVVIVVVALVLVLVVLAVVAVVVVLVVAVVARPKQDQHEAATRHPTAPTGSRRVRPSATAGRSRGHRGRRAASKAACDRWASARATRPPGR